MSHPLGDLGVTYALYIAPWKDRGRLFIRHNWTFLAISYGWDVISLYLYQAVPIKTQVDGEIQRRKLLYKRKSVEVGVFRAGWVLSANISGGRRQFPASPVRVERLEISVFCMLLRYWQMIISFCHNTRIWQTDRIPTAIQCFALHAVAWWKRWTGRYHSSYKVCVGNLPSTNSVNCMCVRFIFLWVSARPRRAARIDWLHDDANMEVARKSGAMTDTIGLSDRPTLRHRVDFMLLVRIFSVQMSRLRGQVYCILSEH